MEYYRYFYAFNPLNQPRLYVFISVILGLRHVLQNSQKEDMKDKKFKAFVNIHR